MKLSEIGPQCREDHLMGVTRPVAATQKFNPNGAKFVYLDSVGRITVAATNQGTLYGWACSPTSLEGTAASSGYWTSGAAGVDSLLVYPAALNLGVLFRVPLFVAGDGLDAICGEGCNVNTLTGTTYMQTVDVSTGVTPLALLVMDLPADGDVNSILVCFSPLLIQTDAPHS